MPGPYFAGQTPASCGHFYPDVLRLRDEKRADGALVRIVDCLYCGRQEWLLDPQELDAALVRKLNRRGREVGIKEGDIAKVRKRAMARLASKQS